jgi:hypothetical protein
MQNFNNKKTKSDCSMLCAKKVFELHTSNPGEIKNCSAWQVRWHLDWFVDNEVR